MMLTALQTVQGKGPKGPIVILPNQGEKSNFDPKDLDVGPEEAKALIASGAAKQMTREVPVEAPAKPGKPGDRT